MIDVRNKMEISVPRDHRVLVVDDSHDRLDWFQKYLGTAICAETSEDAISLLTNKDTFDTVFLDHDAGCDVVDGKITFVTFMPVIEHLVALGFDGDIVIHTGNIPAAQRIQSTLRYLGGTLTLAPYGTFYLKRSLKGE